MSVPQEWDPGTDPGGLVDPCYGPASGRDVRRLYALVRLCVRRWEELQDCYRIITNTPSVLVGYRVEVYRSEGTTQWYTAVIGGHDEETGVSTMHAVRKTRSKTTFCSVMNVVVLFGSEHLSFLHKKVVSEQ